MNMIDAVNRRVRLLLVGDAVALACGAVVLAQTVPPETFAALVARLQQQKPTFAKRQQDMLVTRYDLSDRGAPGVTMSRGKAVPAGVTP